MNFPNLADLININTKTRDSVRRTVRTRQKARHRTRHRTRRRACTVRTPHVHRKPRTVSPPLHVNNPDSSPRREGKTRLADTDQHLAVYSPARSWLGGGNRLKSKKKANAYVFGKAKHITEGYSQCEALCSVKHFPLCNCVYSEHQIGCFTLDLAFGSVSH